jgi:hypothetical protein
LRTLTLGVLIVSGGILAALPFRRYQTIPDASTGPAQATGPTQSAISERSLKMLVDSKSAGSSEALSPPELPIWTPPEQPKRRSESIPLTYEDLLVPIDRPDNVQQRFSATVEARQSQPDNSRLPELVMPALESLALSQQHEIESRIAVVGVDADRPRANSRESQREATLASATWRSAATDALPPADQTMRRQRHWIRQPD